MKGVHAVSFVPTVFKLMAKRKAVAELGQSRRAAARRLQRWERGWLPYVGLEDPVALERPRPERRLLIVEPNSVVYAFDAPTLARGYVVNASFEHPVTRRPLLSPELRRLRRRLQLCDQAPLAKLTDLTFQFAPELRRFLAERSDLPDCLHSLAAERLDAALTCAEGFCDLDVVEEELDEYEAIVTSVFFRARSTTRRLLRLHAALLERRSEGLRPWIVEEVRGRLRRLRKRYWARAHEAPDDVAPALAHWIAQ
jgi:hypothetical protein